jgi:GAF domain-containing protein/two-component sensor histidine kinase
MDTRTVATVSAGVWELLARLAALARHGAVPDRQALVSQVTGLVESSLGCPQGMLHIDFPGQTHEARWGEQAGALARNGEPRPGDMVAIQLQLGPGQSGLLQFEASDELRELLDSGLRQALREQIELVFTLAQTPAPVQPHDQATLHLMQTTAQRLGEAERIAGALRLMLQDGTRALGADWGALLLVDDAAGTLRVAASDTDACPREALTDQAQQTLLLELLRSSSATVLSCDDPQAAPLLNACGCVSMLACPLRAGTHPVGLLLIGGALADPGTAPDNLMLADVLARQIGGALAGVHLATDEQRRSGIFAALQALSQRTGTARSATEVYHTLVDGAHALMSFRAFEIRTFDPAGQQLTAALTSGIRHRVQPHTCRLGEGLAGYVARERRPLRLGDLADTPVKPLFVSLNSGNGSSRIQSYIGLPIVYGGQLFGTFELFSDRPAHFSINDERLLALLTNQAAQTLASLQRSEQTDAHLHRRIQQLRALQRISRELTATLYLHNVLAFALDEAVRATGAHHGFIALRGYTTTQEIYDLAQEDALGVTPSPQVYVALRENDERQGFHIITVAGYPVDAVEHLLNTEIGGSIAEQTARRGEPMLLNGLAADDRPRGVGPAVASTIAVPIYYEAQVIGVINLHSALANAFDRDALEFTRAVADLAALAIGNEQRWVEQRRQRDLLQQRASMLNEVLRIGQELRADRSLQDVLEQVAFSAAEAAGYRAAAFFLYGDDPASMEFVAAAGLPLTEIERLRRERITESVRQQILSPQHRVGRCFFIAGERMRQLAPSLDLTEGDSLGEPTSQTWQPNDALYVPLYSTRGQLLGVLAADEPYDRQRPSGRSVEGLEIFADQAAIAIENASLLRDARDQTERVTALYRVSASMAAAFDLDDLLERSYAEIVGYLGVPSFAYVASYDPGEQTMRFELFKREGVDHERYRKALLPKSGWTSWVIDSDSVIHLRDVRRESEQLPVAPISLGEEIGSWIGIPLRSGNDVIGVLSVQSFEPYAFSDEDVQFLSTLANHMAVALEKARLFEATQQSAEKLQHKVGELSALLESARVLSSTLQPQEVLNSLMAVVQRHLRVDTVALWQNDGEEMLLPAAMLGIPLNTAQTLRVPVGRGMTGRVASGSSPVVVVDVEQDGGSLYPDFNRQNHYTSFLGVPVRYRERTIGVLSVMTITRRHFTQDDIQLLTGMADQAAVALENAHLFEEREKRLREVVALKDMSSAITSTLDTHDVLERLHTEIGHVIDLSTSAMVMYDAEADMMLYPIAYDRGKRLQLDPQPVGGPAGWVIRHRRPLLLHTAEEYQALGWSGPHFGEGDAGEQSFLAVPIVSGDAVVGVIDIQSYEQHAFDADDLRFMVTVASQASVAISNAHLFQERGRRIQELATFNQIGQELSAVTSQNELLELVYRQTSRLLDTQYFYIALYDERRDLVTLPLVIESGERQPLSEPLTLDNTLTGHVLRTRSPLLLNADVDGEIARRGIRALKRIGAGQQAPRAWLGVPMLASDKVIGAIGIQSLEREHAYSPDDVRLLETIAAWAATALENARLLGETRQSVQDLTALYDVSVILAGQLETADLLSTTASSVLELLSADVAVVSMAENGERGAHAVAPVVIDLHANGDSGVIAQAIAPLNEQLLASPRPFELHELPDELAQATGLRSLFGVPILAEELPIGALWVGSRNARGWDGRAISLLSILTNQLSQTLARARLFQSEQARRRIADTLRETAQMFTTLRPFNEIVELIFDQLTRVLSFDTASLMLRIGDELHIVGSRGFEPHTQAQIHELHFTISDDLYLEQVVTTRQPIVLDDAQATPYFVPAEGTEHVRGWIGAPILVDDEVIGLVNVDSRNVGAFDDEDSQLVFALASQAAQAIRNARLYEEVTQLNADLEQRVIERTAELKDEQDRLRAVHAITIELTATLELEPTLNKALELAARAVGARRGSIMLRDPEQDLLSCRAVLNATGEVVTTDIPISFAQGGGLSGWVMRSREPVCIDDVREDERWLREQGRADEVRSVIAAPLMTQDGPLGVLILSSPREAFFSPAQLQLLATIANEVAIVIHNATLYKVISELAYDRGISEAQQREENSKNQAILQSLGEGVMVLDEQQQVVLFNPAAEQMLSIPASLLAGQALPELLRYAARDGEPSRAGAVYEGLVEGLHMLADRGRNYNRMLELGAPAQTLALNFAPWVGPRGAVFGSVIVLRDVTREIESDRAKREFISSVSHELRTPLTSIKGYVDLLLLGAGGQLSESQQSFLGVVKNNANRLMDLINDILEIGRIDSERIQLNFEEVDIAAVFADVLQTLKVQIDRKAMRVTSEVSEDVPPVSADGKRIMQVVLNLASNAVKYTYSEGRIVLRAGLNPAGMLQVDIEDDGVGISHEDQKNLFRRFQRFDNPLRDEAGGTGLGLSIAKSLVELHGGEMWVQSEPGEGSTFSFVIPLTQPEQSNEQDM